MVRVSFAPLFVLVVSSALPAVPAMAQSPHTHDHSFSGAENWARVFDDPKRDASQKPHEVILALALKPAAVVADIGSGASLRPPATRWSRSTHFCRTSIS